MRSYDKFIIKEWIKEAIKFTTWMICGISVIVIVVVYLTNPNFYPYNFTPYNISSYNCNNFSLDLSRRLPNEDVYIVVGAVPNESNISAYSMHAFLEINGEYYEPQFTHKVFTWMNYTPIYKMRLNDFEKFMLSEHRLKNLPSFTLINNTVNTANKTE